MELLYFGHPVRHMSFWRFEGTNLRKATLFRCMLSQLMGEQLVGHAKSSMSCLFSRSSSPPRHTWHPFQWCVQRGSAGAVPPRWRTSACRASPRTRWVPIGVPSISVWLGLGKRKLLIVPFGGSGVSNHQAKGLDKYHSMSNMIEPHRAHTNNGLGGTRELRGMPVGCRLKRFF